MHGVLGAHVLCVFKNSDMSLNFTLVCQCIQEEFTWLGGQAGAQHEATQAIKKASAAALEERKTKFTAILGGVGYAPRSAHQGSREGITWLHVRGHRQ